MWLDMKPGPFEGTKGGSIVRVDDGSPPLQTLEPRRCQDSPLYGFGTIPATAEIGRQRNTDGTNPVGVGLTPRVSDSRVVKPDNENQFGSSTRREPPPNMTKDPNSLS